MPDVAPAPDSAPDSARDAADPGNANAWPALWAALYDDMDVDRTPHLDFYAGLVTPGTGALLDLGCGTGSITVEMAARMAPGARVVGVDLSPKMVEIARARAPAHDWRVGDIAAPPVDGAFDLVVVCFHTLQLLLDPADLGRCFRAAADRLAPGGRFAFDLYRPNAAWLAAVDPGPVVARRFADASGRALEVVETGGYDPASRVLWSSWRLRDAATGAMLPVPPIEQRLRQYEPDEIAAALAAAGLAVLERHGDLDRRPFGAGTKRQVYVCGAA